MDLIRYKEIVAERENLRSLRHLMGMQIRPDYRSVFTTEKYMQVMRWFDESIEKLDEILQQWHGRN